jgi:hypothetical protein
MLSDFELLEQINRDVRRTFPDLAFFQKEIHQSVNCGIYAEKVGQKRRSLGTWLKYSKTETDFGVRRRTTTNPIPSETPEYHWESIERILFLYCKVNPGIGYVQGMNNIVAPIYYVYANDSESHTSGNSF